MENTGKFDLIEIIIYFVGPWCQMTTYIFINYGLDIGFFTWSVMFMSWH